MPITLKAARVNQNLTQAEAAKALKLALQACKTTRRAEDILMSR